MHLPGDVVASEPPGRARGEVVVGESRTAPYAVIIVRVRRAPPSQPSPTSRSTSIPPCFKWGGVPFQITWHGFFTAVGTLVGIWLAVRWAVCAGYTEDDTFSVAMWGVIGAIIGARLFHVIDQWDFYAKDPIQIVKINEGGLAIYGTIVVRAARRRAVRLAQGPERRPAGRRGRAATHHGHGHRPHRRRHQRRAPRRPRPGLSAGGGLHQPEHAGRDRRPGPPGGRLRAGAGPADLRGPGLAGARVRPPPRRQIAIQLGPAPAARRHDLLDIPPARTRCAASSSSSIGWTRRSRWA